MRRVLLVAVLWCLLSGSAGAQTHVAGAIGLDLVRTASIGGVVDQGGTGGEVLSGAVRAGTHLGASWGIELEVAMSAELEHERDNDPRILASIAEAVGPGATGSSTVPVIFPPIDLRVRQRQQYFAMNPTLFVVQPVTDAIELKYLGGVAFSRVRREVQYSLFQPAVIGIDLSLYAPTTESVTYDVGAMAGVESSIRLTGHLRFVPGIRLQTFSGTWVVRTTIGAAWAF